MGEKGCLTSKKTDLLKDVSWVPPPDDEAMVVPWKELWGEDDVPGSDPRYARAYAFPCTCAAIT